MNLPENSLKPSTATLMSYTGTPIPQHRICSLSCTFKGETKVTDFFVTEAPGPAIIGLPSSEKFGIITLNCSLSKKLPRIKYKPGREVAVADALSRLPVKNTDAILNLEVQIHDVHSQFSTEILSRIKSETAKDVELNVLREVIYTGWPETRSEAPSLSRPYWNCRDELSIEDGLIVKGERIVIPASMTTEILEKLHAAHQGAEKMKLGTHSAVFQNGINKDIDQTASHCTECQEAQPRQTQEELKPTDIPPYAWHTVGADLFFLDNADYLILADYHSKYPFVYKLPSTESTTISRCLKSLFSEQGVLAILKSDNGPKCR